MSTTVSIIVPTHNRATMLRRHLDALCIQEWPLDDMEVIVVADSCVDDTVATVEQFATTAPFKVRLISHQARSAAATRQAGAKIAQGETLIFLDDDIHVSKGFVRAHMEAQVPNGVVLGYSKPVLPAKPTRWQRDAHRWWEDSFRTFARPGHRFSYRDFFSGNASMATELFWRVGGFDLNFKGRLEDYELGLRLIKAGALFRFVAAAVGDHYDQTNLTQWLKRIRQEGAADVQIARLHPELRGYLFGPIYHPSTLRRAIRAAAFAAPKRGSKIERYLIKASYLLEQFGLRYRWQQVIWMLREYNYYRGIAGVTGSRKAYKSWLGEVPPRLSQAIDAPMIDLSRLPEEAKLEHLLEIANTKGVVLAHNGIIVLSLPPQPGAEPLQLKHLQQALRDHVENHFNPALALGLARATQGSN
jgi:GT2 family glycosyltransferase